MLTIAHPHPTQTFDAARSPGGFVWWYADLRGTSGEGLVVIWSLGLPFLPGSRNAAPALTRPAVSIAHYAARTQQLYLLQDYAERDASLELKTGSGRIGRSQYDVSKASGHVTLNIDLDEPLPSSTERLRGHISLTGPSTAIPSEASAERGHHIWAPQSLSARGRADLNYGGTMHRVEGSGYFDSNVSDTPLHEQEIVSWRWGRLSFKDHTVVYYEVEETNGVQRYVYRQAKNGAFERLSGRLSFSDERRGKYRLTTPHEILFVGTKGSMWARSEATVEDGPFYSRSLLSAVNDRGERGEGFAEVVMTRNIDVRWQRPLVRMRTHQVGRDNSFFLPLFVGPREGRASRILASLLTRQASA